MGTEIFRTPAPNPYFSVLIFLSDPFSSSSPLFESFGSFVVSCHWFPPQARLSVVLIFDSEFGETDHYSTQDAWPT